MNFYNGNSLIGFNHEPFAAMLESAAPRRAMRKLLTALFCIGLATAGSVRGDCPIA